MVSAYVSVVVELMVGQLELVEADHLLHPLCAASRGVGMKVNPGANVTVTILSDFRQFCAILANFRRFSAKKWRFSKKPML
jgi:hypothetical protein